MPVGATPALNVENPVDEAEGVDLVPHAARRRGVKAALGSFGFGATSATVVFQAG